MWKTLLGEPPENSLKMRFSASTLVYLRINSIIQGSLEVKLPTIWTDEKQRWEESEKRREEKRSEKRNSQKKEDAGALFEVELSKKCTPLWRVAHFEVNMYKTHHARSTFGSWDDEKVHAIVARSAFHFEFRSVQNWRVRSTFWSWDVENAHDVVARNTTCSDHFWTFNRTTLHYNKTLQLQIYSCNYFNNYNYNFQFQLQLHYNYNYTATTTATT